MSIFEAMPKWCVIFGLACWSFSARAQMPLSEHFSDRHGLHSNTIYSLFQDSKGYLWVGTDKGVMRSNGESFEEIMHQRDYPLLEVYSMKEDHDGKIWFSTRNCQLFTYSDGDVERYQYNHVIDSVRPDRSLYISDWRISSDTLELSILGRNSFSVLGNGRARVSQNGSFRFSSTDDGTLLEIIRLDKICLLQGHYPIKYERGLSALSSTFYVPKDVYTCDIRTLNQSEAPVFTAGEMIYRFREDTCLAFNAGAPITSLAEDRSGNIWIGIFKGGIRKLDSDLRPVEDHIIQFEGYTISALLIDQHDQMWVGTSSQGLFKIRDQGILSFANDDQLDAETVGMVLSDSVLTAVFQGGRIFKYDFRIGKSENLNVSKFGELNGVRNMAVDSLNRLWILSLGSGEIVLVKEDGSGEAFVPRKPYVGRYLTNVNNRIWAFGGGGSLQICDISSHDPRPILELSDQEKEELNLVGMLIHDVHSLEGEILLLATNRGLLKLGDEGLTSIAGEYGTEPAQEIHGIVDLKDGFAFHNTTQGVFGEYQGRKFTLNRSDGLLSNFVITMMADENSLFIGTSEGLQVVALEKLTSGVPPHIALTNCKVRQLAQAMGKLWVGTEAGVVCVGTDQYHSPPQPSLFASKSNNSLRRKNDDSVYEFPRNAQEIQFAFEAVDITNFGPFHFEYMVEPVHSQWQANSNGVIQLSGLGEGDYELKVRVHHGHGIYSETSSHLFTVLPFFFFSWWFIFIIALVLAGSMWVFTIYTRRKERKRLAARNRMALLTQQATSARMDPHFIFNSLNSLKYFIKTKDLENASRYLNDFAKLMRSNIEYAKDDFIEVWREKELLTNYVKLENMRMGDTLDFTIKIDPSLESDFKIPTMILQPLLENSIWHGLGTKEGHKEIKVVGMRIDQELRFIVEDNGVGRKVAAALSRSTPSRRKRHSLDFIEERLVLLSQIHGRDFSISIRDKMNARNQPLGTVCKITFPIIREIDLIRELL